MGRLFVISLEGSIYSCKHCHTHLGLADDIISKLKPEGAWLGRQIWHSVGVALSKGDILFPIRVIFCDIPRMEKLLYLISVNITVGEKEERMMLTGMHTVVDIFCVGCGSVVGWKYEAAQEKAQKYKEGKYILERFKVLGPDQAVGER